MSDKRVSSTSKGYELLKKAGWVEGTGLGAQEQGRTTPLQPWLNDGRRGIGCAPKKNPPSLPQSTTPPAPPAQKSKRRRKTREEKESQQRIRHDGVQYRAIRRKLEADVVPGGTDSNPLLRRHALSASNPLLP